MEHSFHPSTLDKSKCATCKFDAISHTDMATCEACDNIGKVDLIYGNMLMCSECIEKDKQADIERNKPENIQARIDAGKKLRELNSLAYSKEIDDSIQIRTDLFNAATVSIVDLKATIDFDASITNKPFALASELKDRFNHFKDVVFELNEKIVEAGNQQKAIQVYLNQLANQLRQEERDKLHIADMNYSPKPVKSIKPKKIKTASKKLDKVAIRKYASELGIAEFTLQMVVVSKGITVEAAANMLRKSINESLSESTPDTTVKE